MWEELCTAPATLEFQRVLRTSHGKNGRGWRVASGSHGETSQDSASSSGPGCVPCPQDGACAPWSCGFAVGAALLARRQGLGDNVVSWGWAAVAGGSAQSDTEGQLRRGRGVTHRQRLPALPSFALQTTHRRLASCGVLLSLHQLGEFPALDWTWAGLSRAPTSARCNPCC